MNAGWQGRLMQSLPQIGSAVFGNKGGAIGGAISTIFGGQGSGEGGKATGMDIIRGIGGVASQFLEPGSKGANILNTVGGLAGTMFGQGTEGMSFGQRLGHLGKDFLGRFGNNMLGQMTGMDGAGLNQALGNILGATQGAGGKRGADQKLVGGGQQAVVEAGRGFLNQGYTVFNHPNFKNNKWRKGPPNKSGYDAAARQRSGKGGLYDKGLAFDVGYFGKGNRDAQLQNVANMAYGNKKGLKLTSIIGDIWGKWIFGGTKKPPGSYGVRNKIQMGFGDSQVAGSGDIGMSGSELERMKKVIAIKSGGDPDQMAVTARSLFNQASMGTGTTMQSMTDILNSLGVNENMTLNPNVANKANKAISASMDDKWMSGMLGRKGFSEPQSMALLNSTGFGKGIYSSKSGASSIKFGNTVFNTEDNKFFNTFMKNSDLGIADGKNPMFPSRAETDTKKKKNQRGSAFASQTMYSPSSAGPASSGNMGSGSILGGPSNSGGQQAGAKDTKREESYALQKVYKDRAYSREQISERTRRLVAETMAAVEAHNASVRANVAAAASAVEKMKTGGGGSMPALAGAKASLNAANLQSNFSIAKF